MSTLSTASRRAAALVLTSAVLVGCGGRPAPDETVQRFIASFRERDYRDSCDQLTRDAQTFVLAKYVSLLLDRSEGKDVGQIDRGTKELSDRLDQPGGLSEVASEECPTAIADSQVNAGLLNNSLDEPEDVDAGEERATVSTEDGDWRLVEIDDEWRIDGPLPFVDE